MGGAIPPAGGVFNLTRCHCQVSSVLRAMIIRSRTPRSPDSGRPRHKDPPRSPRAYTTPAPSPRKYTTACRQVSDEGGGIPRSGLPRIWSYLYSTAKSPVQIDDNVVESGGPNVLAGYGYGLPIRCVYVCCVWLCVRMCARVSTRLFGVSVRLCAGVLCPSGFRADTCEAVWVRACGAVARDECRGVRCR
jgi:hypothetical protein